MENGGVCDILSSCSLRMTLMQISGPTYTVNFFQYGEYYISNQSMFFSLTDVRCSLFRDMEKMMESFAEFLTVMGRMVTW